MFELLAYKHGPQVHLLNNQIWKDILKEYKTFLMGASHSSMNIQDVTQKIAPTLSNSLSWFLMCKKEVETKGSYSAFVNLLTDFRLRCHPY